MAGFEHHTVEEHPWVARLLHWVHLLSFLILAFTGLAIHFKPLGWPLHTIITAHDLSYMDDQRYQELYDLGREAERALNGYIAYIWKQQQGQAQYGARLIAEEGTQYEPSPPDAATKNPESSAQ